MLPITDFKCHHSCLGNARRRDLFVKVLEQVRRRYQFVVVGYVVMPEHFHLLISEPEKGNLSTVIQALKLGIVRQLFPTSPKNREKWGHPGTFLSGRFLYKRKPSRVYILVLRVVNDLWKCEAPLLAKSARNGAPGSKLTQSN